MITEEELLDESWLDSPPCECILEDGRLCGKPAAYRIISRCAHCPTVSGFACAPCWHFIRPWVVSRMWTCAFCGRTREVLEA